MVRGFLVIWIFLIGARPGHANCPLALSILPTFDASAMPAATDVLDALHFRERINKTFLRTISREELSHIFLTADPHFFHDKIIARHARPFATGAEMNESLIADWNRAVGPNDEIWILGDVTNRPAYLTDILSRLNGRKILFLGDYDMPHPVSMRKHKRDIAELPRFLEIYRKAGFAEVHLFGEANLPGVGKINIGHFPYAGDLTSSGGRTPLAQLADDGAPLLCAHVHRDWVRRAKMRNVGGDVRAFRPIPLGELVSEIESPANETFFSPLTNEVAIHRRNASSVDYSLFEIANDGDVAKLLREFGATDPSRSFHGTFGEVISQVRGGDGKKYLEVWLPFNHPAYDAVYYRIYSRFSVKLRQTISIGNASLQTIFEIGVPERFSFALEFYSRDRKAVTDQLRAHGLTRIESSSSWRDVAPQPISWKVQTEFYADKKKTSPTSPWNRIAQLSVDWDEVTSMSEGRLYEREKTRLTFTFSPHTPIRDIYRLILDWSSLGPATVLPAITLPTI